MRGRTHRLEIGRSLNRVWGEGRMYRSGLGLGRWWSFDGRGRWIAGVLILVLLLLLLGWGLKAHEFGLRLWMGWKIGMRGLRHCGRMLLRMSGGDGAGRELGERGH